MIKLICLTAAVALVLTAADMPKPPKVFGGGAVEEVLWVRLDKGDDVLNSLMAIFKEKDIHDGAVLNAVGNLAACKFHGVNGTMTTLSESLEILNLAGMIADGKPHLHVIVSNKARGALGGHLEEGCVVGATIEVMVARFKGPAMTRKPALQPK